MVEDIDRPSFALPVEPPAKAVVPRAAATVILAREGEAGFEVFMLERHLRSDFAGGAYVFPGGTLDTADLDPSLADEVVGWRAPGADMREDDERTALGLIVCAIRETFEESGVLLARVGDGSPVSLRDAAWAERRRALAAGETTAVALARETGIRYDAELLRFWGRWVTPEFAPRRYDARFFVALAPEGQEPLHDSVETTASRWVRPLDAVAEARAGRFQIIFPTRKALEAIGRFDRARDLFDASVGRPAEPILPRVVMVEGEPRVVLPGDPTYHEP